MELYSWDGFEHVTTSVLGMSWGWVFHISQARELRAVGRAVAGSKTHCAQAVGSLSVTQRPRSR